VTEIRAVVGGDGFVYCWVV